MVQAVDGSNGVHGTGSPPPPTPTPQADDAEFRSAMDAYRRGEREAADRSPPEPRGPLVTPTPTARSGEGDGPPPLEEQRAGERDPAGTPPIDEDDRDPVTVPTREEAAADALAAQRAGERDPGPTPQPPPIQPVPTLEATRPSGITTRELDLPAPPPGRPGPGWTAGDVWNAVKPDFLTLGATFGENYPAKGAVLLSMPLGNGPHDFTTRDGTPANSIIGNWQVVPNSNVPILKDLGPGAGIVSTQYLMDPPRWAYGVGGMQRIPNPVLPFTAIAAGRASYNPFEDETTISGSLSVNVPVDALVSRAAFATAGVATALAPVNPALAGVAVKAAEVGYKAEALGAGLANGVRPVVGFGWNAELRFDQNLRTGEAADFTGLYHRGERVALPGFIEEAIEQENAAPIAPQAGPLASFATRILTNALEEVPPAGGGAPAGRWRETLPAPLDHPIVGVIGDSVMEEALDPQPAHLPPGLGLARRLVANASDEGRLPFLPPGSTTGWAETLLGLPSGTGARP